MCLRTRILVWSKEARQLKRRSPKITAGKAKETSQATRILPKPNAHRRAPEESSRLANRRGENSAGRLKMAICAGQLPQLAYLLWTISLLAPRWPARADRVEIEPANNEKPFGELPLEASKISRFALTCAGVDLFARDWPPVSRKRSICLAKNNWPS